MKLNYPTLSLLVLFSLVFNLNNAQVSLSQSSFESVVTSYFDENLIKYKVQKLDYEDLVIQNQVFSKSTGITHLYLNQRYRGIKIYNAISSLAIKNNEVFYYANRFIPDIANKVNAINPVLTPFLAIEKVSQSLGLSLLENIVPKETRDNKYIFTKGNISQVDIPVELMFFAKGKSELRLVWDLSIFDVSGKNWWTVRIDAVTGEIVDIQDYILTCNFGDNNHLEHLHVPSHITQEVNLERKTSAFSPNDNSRYNVFALPIESPIHGNRQIVIEPASGLASPFGWHDTDGIPGTEHTITRGNNVWAMEDRAGTNQIGYSPDGTASLNFDFELNLDQPPAFYEDAAITNLFYTNNMMHDIFYHYGFDEESGNFQQNNYGRGGIENDFVYADAQDGSGLNNATFGTPPDGQNPVMTMFLWSASGPQGNPLIINNSSFVGEYPGIAASFGNPLSIDPLTSDLALVIDSNAGASTDFFDACDAILNGTDLKGKIAVIRRGSCEFGAKVFAAQNEGAIAVIMVNNVPDAPITMGPGAAGNLVNIPSVMINQELGEQLINALIDGQNINVSLVAAPPFQKDGDFDNGIIAHEYGHGISNRLTAGPSTVNCLFNDEQMGEGWSDWFGLMVTMKASDIPQTGRGIATYSIGQDINGSGIRPARYSTDTGVNGFTYNATNNPSLSIPHGVGFVWATMLWDLTWAYIDKYGFDSDLYNGNGGNNKVMQLVLDGLKLQPCQPGFIDGRDALLAADLALTGGEDQCMIWEVFAQRGLGFNATQGLSTERDDQVQDFSLPPSSLESLASCNSLSTSDILKRSIEIYPNPTSGDLTISGVNVLSNATISLYDLNGRIIKKQSNIFENSITIDLSHLQPGMYIISIANDNFTYSEKIIKQ
ncbi:T9SS type A sorting domain-containing protein [Paucihalobacter ruber]|uniref:T9SS type A sorting domain-containing protein n=1 Tax=Paucihalobacter ruber TaxID=2567861 RepID=A0A506PQN8_9FLAO|nr:T9SS-dependent M36 family metallopeptidase [Paucihalobacter ruber]TPV35919.1 T9SS type A sorting domain-containing protein [Paucihalobacter ruber]